MQTVRELEKIDISPSLIIPTLNQVQVSTNHTKKLKIREFISWSVCFGVVAGLTGLLKILNVGVTMEVVTSSLFYLSLGGLIYFISKIVSLSKNPLQNKAHEWHDLN